MTITNLIGEDISLTPSPDPTVSLNYSPIINYIKERIETLEKKISVKNLSYKEFYSLSNSICELQLVISKIEELGK